MKVYVVQFFYEEEEIPVIDTIWMDKELADKRVTLYKEAWVEEHYLEDLP